MPWALLFKQDGSGRIVVPMDKETREDLEEKHKAHFEERFDTKEAAETKLQKLDDNEGAGSWSG